MAYDDDGLVTEINDYVISRNAQNGLPEVLDDGTLQQNRSYNGYGEATNINTSVDGNGIYDYALTYNNIGKITAKEETLDDGTVNNYVYGYDDKRQLISVTLNGTEVESYDYDANGNRINQNNTVSGIINQSATYNLGDQLESNGDTTYEYDADGYLSKKISTTGTPALSGAEETTYQYSSQGRLLEVQTPSDTISYQHNALGNRVAKSVNGVIVEKYLWLDKTTLLATYDGNDDLVQRFEYADGNTPSSFTQGGQTFYIVTDHLGTPRAVTNSSGLVLKKITYDSFGNVLSDSNPAISIPFGFAGGLQDVDTGLVRFGFRDYDPETGRWTARDPIGFAGGDTNLYGYVTSDPINWIDPEGESKTKHLLNAFFSLMSIFGNPADPGELRDSLKGKRTDQTTRIYVEKDKKDKGKGKKRSLVLPDIFEIVPALLKNQCDRGNKSACEALKIISPTSSCPKITYI